MGNGEEMLRLLYVMLGVGVSMGVVLQLSRIALALEPKHGWKPGLGVAGVLAVLLWSAFLRAARTQTGRAIASFGAVLLAVVVGGLAGAEVLQADPAPEPDRKSPVLPPVTQVVMARDFEFVETIIKMAPGYRTIELRNDGSVAHSLRIESLPGVRLEAEPGTSDVEAGRMQPGIHVFFCQMPGHRAAGMEGTLVVSS